MLQRDRSRRAPGRNWLLAGMVRFAGVRARTFGRDAADNIDHLSDVGGRRITAPCDMSVRAHQDIVRSVGLADRRLIAQIHHPQREAAYSRGLRKTLPDRARRLEAEQDEPPAEQVDG